MKDPNYKRQKKTLGLYVSTKHYQMIEKIAADNNESRSATAKMLIVLGMNVYRASGEAAAEVAQEARLNQIHIASLD